MCRSRTRERSNKTLGARVRTKCKTEDRLSTQAQGAARFARKPHAKALKPIVKKKPTFLQSALSLQQRRIFHGSKGLQKILIFTIWCSVVIYRKGSSNAPVSGMQRYCFQNINHIPLPSFLRRSCRNLPVLGDSSADTVILKTNLSISKKKKKKGQRHVYSGRCT